MFPVERRKAILEILDKRNSVSVEELSKTLFTGEATVRRDLDKMAREGIITRTHGGAVRLQNENIDYPLSFRESENGRVKDELCAAAAQLVSDGQSLFLDGSSTVIRIIGKITFFTVEPSYYRTFIHGRMPAQYIFNLHRINS